MYFFSLDHSLFLNSAYINSGKVHANLQPFSDVLHTWGELEAVKISILLEDAGTGE